MQICVGLLVWKQRVEFMPSYVNHLIKQEARISANNGEQGWTVGLRREKMVREWSGMDEEWIREPKTKLKDWLAQSSS